MKSFPYKEVFQAIEKRLIEVGSTQKSKQDIKNYLDSFKKFENRALTDNQYFKILVFVTFYSGFKAKTVDDKSDVIEKYFPGWEDVCGYSAKKIAEISDDGEMIGNKSKITACVENAKIFSILIARHGSIKNYINSYNPSESLENLLLLKEDLEATFSYLGGITVYHFMTDIGLQVLKPDRVICRIFKRLGLLQNSRQLFKATIHGRKFSAATGLPIRYIDRVLVAYGQEETMKIGISSGICLEKNPRCDKCPIKNKYCKFNL